MQNKTPAQNLEAKGPEARPLPKLIVFGLDEARKPRAAYFSEDDIAKAQRAAELMGLQTLKIDNDERRTEAGKLRQGRLLASGRAILPAVTATAYAGLTALQDHKPAHLAPGTTESTPQAGATPVKASLMGAPAISRPPLELPSAKSSHRPWTWGEIRVGSVVLAPEHDEESWWPAVVLNMPTPDRLILKWRDTFEEPAFTRQRNQIGLLNPVRNEAPLASDEP